MKAIHETGLSEKAFAPLLRLGAWLSVTMLVLIPLQMAIFILCPPPDTVEGFFRLYRQSWVLGLLDMDFLYILNNTILIFLYTSLAICLMREKPAATLAALLLGLVGIACYYPTNPAFEMLNLSHGYWKAAAETQGQYLAAGEALLAGYQGTAFDVYYVFNAVALLLFAGAVHASPRFSRAMGVWGILSGILMLVPSSAGAVGMVFSVLSLLPWAVFLLMAAKRFLALYHELSAA